MIDEAMIIGRLIHILTGMFWVGAMVFVAVFLMPSLAEAGPDGAKVMVGITRRRFMQIMPVVAILTILSGIYLYWRVSAGFEMGYLKSGPGHVYAISGLIAIIAFLIGLTVTRPAMMQAAALAASMGTASAAEREAMAARMQALRARGAAGGKIVATLLVLAAVGMAVARYL